MSDAKAMQKFLSSVHMGSAVIRTLERASKDLASKKIFLEILHVFAMHENALQTAMSDLAVDIRVRLTLGGKMAVWMTKIKAKMKDEFAIVLLGIEAMEMGIEGALTFLYEHSKVNEKFLKVALEVLEDYDNLLTKLKIHAQDYLPITTKKQERVSNEIEGSSFSNRYEK